ncbi:hypothetical protein CEXT_59001 [Caerostris extrusa]|uniref:Uncharacterized protein n=1 Tax=Caerostris extrusa TaxID=172846 RepID=A0AAV4QVR2_CAEEX|nr:hypothetical protein CEXT_59001 [Caerostris extrusa]
MNKDSIASRLSAKRSIRSFYTNQVPESSAGRDVVRCRKQLLRRGCNRTHYYQNVMTMIHNFDDLTCEEMWFLKN